MSSLGFLSSGLTVACFSEDGNEADSSDLFTMLVMTGTSSWRHCFNRCVGRGYISHDFVGESMITWRVTCSVAGVRLCSPTVTFGAEWMLPLPLWCWRETDATTKLHMYCGMTYPSMLELLSRWMPSRQNLRINYLCRTMVLLSELYIYLGAVCLFRFTSN